jgi:predicted Fe-Mo cluster-binding NifX family protein/ferredoxin
MKIAITATGPELDASVDPRFGRCEYFIIVDPQTMEYSSIENPNTSLGGGAGIQSAQLVAQQEVHSVLTGNCGPNAFQTLSAAGIRVITGVSGSIRRAVARFKMDTTTSAAGPNVADHLGMGAGMGGGRGMRRGRGIGRPADRFPRETEEGQNEKENIDLLKNQLKIMEEQLAALKEQIPGKEKGKRKSSRIARVIPGRCTGCEACQEVCPSDAISIIGSVAHVEAAACTGCGRCVAACPRKAIVLEAA